MLLSESFIPKIYYYNYRQRKIAIDREKHEDTPCKHECNRC